MAKSRSNAHAKSGKVQWRIRRPMAVAIGLFSGTHALTKAIGAMNPIKAKSNVGCNVGIWCCYSAVRCRNVDTV